MSDSNCACSLRLASKEPRTLVPRQSLFQRRLHIHFNHFSPTTHHYFSSAVAFTQCNLGFASPSVTTILQIFFGIPIKLACHRYGVHAGQIVVHSNPFSHPALPRIHNGYLTLEKCRSTAVATFMIVNL